MASGCNVFVFLALLVLALVSVGTCLQCYQCGEEADTNKPCVDNNGKISAVLSCPSGACATHELYPGEVEGTHIPGVIARVCAVPNYCAIGAAIFEKGVGLRTKSCTTCTSDYCNGPNHSNHANHSNLKNSGSIAIPSFIVVALLGIKYFI